MSLADFSPLVTLPTIITEPGSYITRSGEQVEITVSSTRNAFACHGSYPDGVIENWHRSGRLYFSMECGNDIVRKA